MVRNIIGCLLAVGRGRQAWTWVGDILQSGDRRLAAPTFMADGLYLASVTYPDEFVLPKTDISASVFHGVLA